MNLKGRRRNNKIKKIAFKVLKPFLPFIILFFGILFAFCTIIDAIFIQEVQTDLSNMPEAEKYIREMCIKKAEYLNTCNNYKGGEKTKYLLDAYDREIDKEIEWAHLYSIMAFHNMIEHTEINEELLDKVASEFESTFIYKKSVIKTETKIIDDEGNERIETKEDSLYYLVESDTIIGHFIYHYKEEKTEKENVKTTREIFEREELIGERYERLRNYLKYRLGIKDDYLETDLEIVLQATNGYYEGSENTSWLQENGNNLIINGKGLIPTGMFIWPIPGYTKITSHYGMRIHPISKEYKMHTGVDVGAPYGASFVAMADGTVIKAAYSNGYGNMVMIDHRKWSCNTLCTWK